MFPIVEKAQYIGLILEAVYGSPLRAQNTRVGGNRRLDSLETSACADRSPFLFWRENSGHVLWKNHLRPPR